jgi:hypothetical protein
MDLARLQGSKSSNLLINYQLNYLQVNAEMADVDKLLDDLL